MEPRSRDMAAVHCNTLVRWVREGGEGRERREGEVRAMDRCREEIALFPGFSPLVHKCTITACMTFGPARLCANSNAYILHIQYLQRLLRMSSRLISCQSSHSAYQPVQVAYRPMTSTLSGTIVTMVIIVMVTAAVRIIFQSFTIHFNVAVD